MDAMQAGERSHTPDLARLCATVLDIWPTLWNFTEHPDAEATNNRAEVRPGAWKETRCRRSDRRTRCCTRDEGGGRFGRWSFAVAL